jgi:ribosomal protein L35AE/L33A
MDNQKQPQEMEVEVRTLEDENSMPYQLMDVADETQIFGDFKGLSDEILGKWVYEFPQDGHTVSGLSWIGTKEIVIWLSKKQKGQPKMILTQLPEYDQMTEVEIDGQKYIDVKVVFKDLVNGRMMSGTVRQPYLNKRGGKIDVSFIPRMAESKAQRNAIQKLIPATSLALFISFARNQGKVQRLVPSKAQMQLSGEEVASVAEYLSQIEQLNSVEEVNQYLVWLNKQIGKLPSKQMYECKRALSVKMMTIKDKLAKDKVKEMTK